LDWFFNVPWLRGYRTRLIDAVQFCQQWFEAAHFFHLQLADIPTLEFLCNYEIATSLLQSGRNGPLPPASSFTKIKLPRIIVDLEDIEAEIRAVGRLLMHRTLDHIALVAGLELPRFGVDHALVGAFFSTMEVDFPLDDLERHGVPLHGIRILEQRDVRYHQ
jgi:hypothetical protein